MKRFLRKGHINNLLAELTAEKENAIAYNSRDSAGELLLYRLTRAGFPGSTGPFTGVKNFCLKCPCLLPKRGVSRGGSQNSKRACTTERGGKNEWSLFGGKRARIRFRRTTDFSTPNSVSYSLVAFHWVQGMICERFQWVPLSLLFCRMLKANSPSLSTETSHT